MCEGAEFTIFGQTCAVMSQPIRLTSIRLTLTINFLESNTCLLGNLAPPSKSFSTGKFSQRTYQVNYRPINLIHWYFSLSLILKQNINTHNLGAVIQAVSQSVWASYQKYIYILITSDSGFPDELMNCRLWPIIFKNASKLISCSQVLLDAFLLSVHRCLAPLQA